MEMDEIRVFARGLGIQSADKYFRKEDLVRTIQLASGREDCFASCNECPHPEKKCEWERECPCRNNIPTSFFG